jgi:hypothetical protein
MPDETITTETVKTASDGTVKIAIEKYNELVEKAGQPKVVNQTVKRIVKTSEMAAQDHKAWGTTFVLGGAAMIVVGVIRFGAAKQVS